MFPNIYRLKKIQNNEKFEKFEKSEKFRGNKLSRKRPKNAKPRKFLAAKVSDLKVDILGTSELASPYSLVRHS